MTQKAEPYLPKLGEVKNRVREDLVEERAAELARQRAAGIVAALRAAKDFPAAAKAEGLEAKDTSLIARDAALPDIGVSPEVDRVAFSDAVTDAVRSHPKVTVEFGEIAGLPPAEWDNVIVATGPLTSRPLAEAIQGLTGEAELAFFDAIAPIVHGESINMDIAWAQSRYDKAGPGGTGQKAQTVGYSVGGKSGTARKQVGKNYASGKYRAWFTGMAPIDKPRIIVAVMIDEPSNGVFYGGAVAAPVFSEVVQQTLRMMGVQPDMAVKPQIVANAVEESL